MYSRPRGSLESCVIYPVFRTYKELPLFVWRKDRFSACLTASYPQDNIKPGTNKNPHLNHVKSIDQ